MSKTKKASKSSNLGGNENEKAKVKTKTRAKVSSTKKLDNNESGILKNEEFNEKTLMAEGFFEEIEKIAKKHGVKQVSVKFEFKCD